MDCIELPAQENDVETKVNEDIILSTANNADAWILLLSTNGTDEDLKKHPNIVCVERSFKWFAKACCNCQDIRVLFLLKLAGIVSTESLGRLCAAVSRPEPKREEETPLEIQISQIFAKCKEHCNQLRKLEELLLFCLDISSDIVTLIDKEDQQKLMRVLISQQPDQTVEDIRKEDYWTPFEGLLAPAEALHALKESRVFRNIAIHCLSENFKTSHGVPSTYRGEHDSTGSSDISQCPVAASVQEMALFLNTKATAAFHERCIPLFDVRQELSLVEARTAWRDVSQNELSEEFTRVEKFCGRGNIHANVKESIGKMLQLPCVVEKAQALLKALECFGITADEDSSLMEKLQNIVHLFGTEDVKLSAIVEAMNDRDVPTVCELLEGEEFPEVIEELGKARDFIAFIKEKGDENMADLTDAVGDYSEQRVTERTVSDLIKVHGFLRGVVAISKDAMALLKKAKESMPRGADIAAKLRSCRNSTQALKSLYAENRTEKTKVIIRDFLFDGYYRLTLAVDGNWSVVMCYRGSERTSGDHTMAHLQDLCCRAHLLVRSKKKSEEEFLRYSEFIDEVNHISEFLRICSRLQRSGHPDFRVFKAELDATDASAIKVKVEEVKEKLDQWEKVLRSTRDKHKYLNFFYSDQLRILDEFFTSKHRVNVSLATKKAAFDLLRHVDPSVTFEELDNFLISYHGPCSGRRSLNDYLGSIGSALDDIFEARLLREEQKDAAPSDAQEFRIVLLEPESSHTVNAMMSLFQKTPDISPKASQVMLCSSETSLDEVSLFLRRCFGNSIGVRHAPLYCMANVECLQGDIQLELVRILRDYLRYTDSPYKLSLIIRAERHHHIVRHFLRFVLDSVPLLTDQELHEILARNFPDVVFVTSDLPGLGKTEWVREDAANKMPPRGITTVPLSGCVSRKRLVQRLSSLNVKGDYECIHFDVSDVEDPLALDTLLFEFVGLGLLSHDTTLAHNPTCHIYIEVANTLNNWLQDSFVVCKCFRRKNQNLKALYDHLIVSSEITSPIQVACHYLHAWDKGILEDTDISFSGPQQVEPLSREVCIEMLSKYYPDPDLTYTRLNTFLKVFADQLLKLSATQVFRKKMLAEVIEHPGMLKTEFVWQLFGSSIDVVRYGQVSQSDVAVLINVPLQGCKHLRTAQAMVSRVEGMQKWSDHSQKLLYVFYGQCMKPLYEDQRLLPENVKTWYMSQGQNKEMPDYKKMTQEELREFLIELSNKKPTDNLFKSYVLTLDNIFKMVFILLRLRAKVPVVIMGETGCGKTTLVKFLAHMYAVPFHTFSLHAGTREDELLSFIDGMKIEAEKAKHYSTPVWVFLDEVNTCAHLGLISEITCHHRVNGTPLPTNLVFISACNPYCIRPSEAGETGGLVGKTPSDEISKLVYRVHPLPEVMLDYVWDFGSLDEKDELSYIQGMIEGLLDDDRGDLFANLLSHSQQFVRETEKTRYCVSLRDIARCKKLLVWFRDVAKNRPQLSPDEVEKHLREDYRYVAGINTEVRSMVLSLALGYHCRFADAARRKAYRDAMEDVMAGDGRLGLKRGDFAKIVRMEEEEYLARMELPPGTAKNAALRENVLVLVTCIYNVIPVFVVGKPGCSKSLSVQVIRSNLSRGAESPDEFLRSLPQLYFASFQGSKSSTSGGISKVFDMAHKYKMYNQDSSVLPVVLLDEVGLAEKSSRDPLKVLHSLLEPTMDETPEVAVVGLSNWSLDPAKMNRAVYLSRPEPSTEDLCETGKSLRHASKGDNADLPSNQELRELAEAYQRYQQTQVHKNFHGLRDYYSFVRCLSQSLTDALSSPDGSKCVSEALQRNFGGVQEAKVIQSLFMGNSPDTNVPAVKDLILKNIQDTSARHLMLLTAGGSSIHILDHVLQGVKKETVTILGSRFEDDLDDYDFRILSEIIFHMEKDCVLIMRDLESIYGSLYDMLNQTYTLFGGRRHCRVALGPYSVPMCQVHDGFRCIVMKDRGDVDFTDAPFLNRFEKQSLHFEEVMSPIQKTACEQLTSWAMDVSTTTDSSLIFDEKDMFVGFNADTIPSLVLHHGHDKEKPFEELISKCKDDLVLTATPDGILRSLKSRLAEKTDEVEGVSDDYLRRHGHQGFTRCVQELVTQNSDEMKGGLKLVVLTHSSVYQVVPVLSMPCETKTLSRFRTQREFSNYVKSFWMESSASMMILQCTPEVNGRHLPLVQNIIEQHRAEFLKCSTEQRSSPPVEKHVCLILHIRKELAGIQNVNIVPKGMKDWQLVTIDSLESPQFPIRSCFDTPVHEVIESHGQLVSDIISDKLVWCFTRIKNLAPERHSKIVRAVRGSGMMKQVLKDRIIEWLKKSSKSTKEEIPWLQWVAFDRKALINSSTFQEAIHSYISEVVERPLAMLVYHLENTSAWNAIVMDQPDLGKIDAWAALLRMEDVVNFDPVQHASGGEFYELDRASLDLSYPFSSVFASRMEEIKQHVLVGAKVYEDREQEDIDPKGELHALGRSFSSQVEPRLREILENEWLKTNMMSYIEDLMDLKTSELMPSGAMSRDCRIVLMKAMLVPYIREISAMGDLVLLISCVHIWFWLNSSLITSVLRIVKLSLDLDSSGRNVDALIQEHSSRFPSTIPEGTKSQGTLTTISKELNGEESSSSIDEGYQEAHFEETLVEMTCEMMLPSPHLIETLGGTKAWQRNASFVLATVTQIFEFCDPPTSFHILRVCSDFMRLLVIPGLASEELFYALSEEGRGHRAQFWNCPERFRNVLLINEKCVDSAESQQFLAVFFRRCIESWSADLGEPHEEVMSTMVKKIFAAAKDARVAYMGPVLKLLVRNVPSSVFYKLLHTSQPIQSEQFLNVLNHSLLRIEEDFGIDARPGVLVCDIIEDYCFRDIQGNAPDSSELNQLSEADLRKLFEAAAALILSKTEGETRGLRKICAVAFMRSLVRSYAEALPPDCVGDSLSHSGVHMLSQEVSAFLRERVDKSGSLSLFLLRELRQRMPTFEVLRLAQSRTILQAGDWDEEQTPKVGRGLLNSLHRCDRIEEAVNALFREGNILKLRTFLSHTPLPSFTGVALFSAISRMCLGICYGPLNDRMKKITNTLIGGLEGFSERYVQLIRCLLGVERFGTPQLQLHAESRCSDVQRTFLLTHVAAWMTSTTIQDAPILHRPLIALMTNLMLCQELYLPGLPGGGDAPAKGYIRVNPEDLQHAWRRVRSLSPAVFRILHLLVHACLYLGCALGIVPSSTLTEFIGAEKEEGELFCFKHILNDLRVLEEILDLRQEDTINLIHLALHNTGELLAFNTAAEVCKEPSAREAWETKFADTLERLLSSKDQRCVRLLPVTADASKPNRQAAPLEERIEEQDLPVVSIDERNSLMPRLFRWTKKISTADLKATFVNDRDAVTKHPFLLLALKHDDVLPLIGHLHPLLKWTREVESHYSHRISREEGQSCAISTKLKELQSKVPECEEAFNDFQEAWNSVVRLLREEFDEHIPTISVDSYISFCLLEEKGNGRFLFSMLEKLVTYQNEFLHEAQDLASRRECDALDFLGNHESSTSIPAVSLYECDNSELIRFQWPTQEDDDEVGFLSYGQQCPDYGRGWDVQYDFGLIERSLASALLWGKAFLLARGDVREFAYSNELFHSGANVLKEIEKVISQKPLTKDLQNRGLHNLKNVDRAEVRDLLSGLEVVLCFLKQTRGDPGRLLVEYIDEWISKLTSFPKANLPQPQDQIQLKHAVALYQGVEDTLAGKAMDGLTDDFRSRYPNARNTAKHIEERNTMFTQEAVLVALHRFMYRYLTSPRDLSICKAPLIDHLTDWTLWPMDKISPVSMNEPGVGKLMQELFPEDLKVEHIFELTSQLKVSHSCLLTMVQWEL